ncbi:UDP-N-acetylmuramoyl-L-alanine--D-glutamate ligase [Hydrogenimonas sp.]
MKKVTLFGYGKTTRAIAARLGPCTFYDDRIAVPHRDEAGNRLMPPSLFDSKNSDIEIPSPGFPPSHPLIKSARHLISEYDLFLSDRGRQYIRQMSCEKDPASVDHRPSTIDQNHPFTIWISGTNGKTTTTKMVTHLLKKRGAVCGGNIGTPLAELDPAAPIWVLETSSFTLHYTKYAKPDLYVLLPVTPDHLGWHESEKAYISDKLKPLGLMREGEAILLPEAFANRASNGYKIPYKKSEDLAAYFDIDSSKIVFEGAFLLDALLALAVTKILFDEVDYDAINAFKVDPHRQESLRDAKGRLWINDSKATNIDATVQALAPHKNRRVLLILGGDDKGVDLDPLMESLETYDIKVFAIGKNAEKIAGLCKAREIECSLCRELDTAVKQMDKEHTKHSVALLSPAAASLDQFASYAQRGEIFKNLISSF